MADVPPTDPSARHAILARREEEIRAFVPEPYWLVDATFEPTGGESGRRYHGRYHAGSEPRMMAQTRPPCG